MRIDEGIATLPRTPRPYRHTVYGCFGHDGCTGLAFDEALITDPLAGEMGTGDYEPVLVFESEHDVYRDDVEGPWLLDAGGEALSAEQVAKGHGAGGLRVLWRSSDAPPVVGV